MRREIVSWEEVDKLVDLLVDQFEREYDAMLIVTRGGIVPGGMLAEVLNITHILTASVDFPAQVESDKSEVTIGRDPEADIQIDNISVSRIHAKIIKGPNYYLLQDLKT